MLLRLAESTGGGVSDSGGATWDKSAIGVDSVGSVADADPRNSDESSVEPTISQTTGNRAMLIPIDTATVTTTATAAAILGMVFSPGCAQRAIAWKEYTTRRTGQAIGRPWATKSAMT